MATAEELRAQIAAAEHQLEERQREGQKLFQGRQQAEERQRMRRELDAVQAKVRWQEQINDGRRAYTEAVDNDVIGPHMPGEDAPRPHVERNAHQHGTASGGEQMVDCRQAVIKGEYVWKIGGFSWLKNTLRQMASNYADSDDYVIAGHSFRFVYHPNRSQINELGQRGSLAILYWDGPDEGITFRYRVFIKRADGEFVQWGQDGNECHPHDCNFEKAFGPDVANSGKAAGIFGMTHEDLLKSDWVESDTLTVKFELELRPNEGWDNVSELRVKPVVEVPPATLVGNLMSLLDDGKYSDVTFVVEGEQIRAHSVILAARSEVFDRLLHGGMRESISKEILIDDCDPLTFKALLRFIYTDDFACLEELVTNARTHNTSSSSNADASEDDKRLSLLQNMLGMSQKYQLNRLRLWCEQQLSQCISVQDVCKVLCQAHLYEAQKLERVCLTFIKDKMQAVVKTAAFGNLTKDWPEVMLKVNLFISGVPESSAGPAIDAQKSSTAKRKRED